MAFLDIDDLKNKVVYFGSHEAIKAGWGVEGSKRGLSVITSDGPRRVEVKDLLWLSQNRCGSLQLAQAQAADAMALAAQVDLRTTWELLLEEGDAAWSLEELAGICGVGSGPEALDGIGLALEGPDTFFRRKGEAWVAWTRKAVEERDVQRQRTAQRKQAMGNVADEIRNLMQGKIQLANVSKEGRSLLASIEQVALQPDLVHAQAQRALATLLPGDTRPAAQQAFDLLVDLALFTRHEDLNLRRLEARVEFPAEVLAETDYIRQQTALAIAQRPDVSHLNAVAIDDPETEEVDDALAIETTPAGSVVHVLIADPSSPIPAGSSTDSEAQRRASTIYHPTARFPMLPPALAYDTLTLTTQGVRLAVDHQFTFDAAGRLVESQIRPVSLRLASRLSYEQVDEILASGTGPYAGQLSQLWTIAQRLLANRVGAGALVLNQVEVRVKVREEKVVRIKRTIPDSPSHRLVAEFMVAAGAQLADFCLTNKLATVYRTQPRPDDDLGFTLERAADPVYIHATIRKLKRAEATTHPGGHSGLGVSLYCQATSPLRRYLDMAAQRQVLTFLQTGRPFYSSDDMVRLLGSVEPTSQLTRKAGDEANRYWLLVDIKERALGQVVDALVLGVDRGQVFVQLVEWGLNARVHAYISTAPGQVIQLKVAAVDPRYDSLTLRSV